MLTMFPALPLENAKVITAYYVAGESVDIILDQTPFYAEGGGQIGDQGYLRAAEALPPSSSSPSAASPGEAAVTDVQKLAGDYFAHKARVTAGSIAVGQQVCCQSTCDS